MKMGDPPIKIMEIIKIYQDISRYIKIYQDISKYIKIYQDISRYIKWLKNHQLFPFKRPFRPFGMSNFADQRNFWGSPGFVSCSDKVHGVTCQKLLFVGCSLAWTHVPLDLQQCNAICTYVYRKNGPHNSDMPKVSLYFTLVTRNYFPDKST